MKVGCEKGEVGKQNRIGCGLCRGNGLECKLNWERVCGGRELEYKWV